MQGLNEKNATGCLLRRQRPDALPNAYEVS